MLKIKVSIYLSATMAMVIHTAAGRFRVCPKPRWRKLRSEAFCSIYARPAHTLTGSGAQNNRETILPFAIYIPW
jgi:hypothetical protein